MRYRLMTLCAGIQAWMGLVYLFFLPADPKNQSFLGFSVYRLLIFAILFSLGLLGLVLFFWKKGAWTSTLARFLRQSLNLSQRIENAFEMGTFCGLVVTIAPILKPAPEWSAIHQRLLPLLVWITLVFFEGAVLLAFENGRSENSGLFAHYVNRWLGNKITPQKEEITWRSGLWLALLLLVTLLIPSNNAALFSGLPLSTWSDGIALLIVLLIVLDSSLRFEWINSLKSIYRPMPLILPLGLGLIMILKLGLYIANTDSGFMACYRAVGMNPPNGKCEMSFENPTFRNQVTRIDKVILFNLDGWNLSFLNTNIFNYFNPGSIDRKRIPFSVDWSGISSFIPGDTLSIDYTGQATMTVGSQVIELKPVYDAVKTINVILPPGDEPVKLNYTFNDGSRIGNPAPGPNAILRLNVYHGNVNKGPLTALPPPLIVRVTLFVADGLFLLLLLSILFIILRRVLPAWRGIMLLSFAGLLAWWGLPELAFMAVMALAFTWLLLWRGQHKVLIAFIVLSVLLWFRVLVYLPDSAYSLLRLETTDMLTYESFARDILVNGGLQGGEPIFYYQALFRYIVYFYHLIFGESDFLRSLFVLLALNMGIFINAEWMFKNRQKQPFWQNVLVWVMYIAIVTLSASSLVFLIQQGISEAASWILLLYAFYFFLVGREGFFFSSAVLLGLAVANRYNHIIALGFLFLIFALPHFRTKKRLILFSILFMTLILATIPLHNWVYGNKFIIMPTSADASVNLILPPATLVKVFSDSDVQQQVLKQISTMFGFVSWKMLDLCIPVFCLMVSWLLLGFDLIKRWKIMPWQTLGLWIFPGLFLGTQFFFYMLANYPRHLYAAYLAMALVGLYTIWYSKKNDQEPVKGT